MSKIQAGASKKRCNHCGVEVSSSNWAKHLKTKRHIAKLSEHVTRTIYEDDSDFELALPTAVPGPSSSPTWRNDEVLTILRAKAKESGQVVKKARTGDKSSGQSGTGCPKAKRDKASTNFLITAHSKRKYVYARCMLHWSRCYIIGREFNNGGFGRKAHLHIFMKIGA